MFCSLLIIQTSCRTSPTSPTTLCPGVSPLSECSQARSCCSSPFWFKIWLSPFAITNLVGNHLILQICKIHLAYATIRMAAMNWENNFKYVFIRKSHLRLSWCSVVMCRNQVVVLAAMESFVLVFILFVVLVMACASHRLETPSHPCCKGHMF